MENEQIINKLDWLDDERRNDKSLITAIQVRLSVREVWGLTKHLTVDEMIELIQLISQSVGERRKQSGRDTEDNDEQGRHGIPANTDTIVAETGT